MTISPLLSAPDATTVALDFGVFIAEQARTHRVSQTAIIAALRPCITPSQPEVPSHAPAADTPASQAAGDKTDGEVSREASPSVETDQPETATSFADVEAHDAEANHGHSNAVASVPVTQDGSASEGGENVAPPSPTHTDTLEPRADAAELAFGSAVEPGAPILPRGRPDKTRAAVLAAHAEHPEWPPKLIAEHIGVPVKAVHAVASRNDIHLPSWRDYERTLKAGKTDELTASLARSEGDENRANVPKGQPEPKAAPKPRPATMADRIKAYVADHPQATAREVADAIGAKLTSISWAAQKAGVTLRKFDAAERSAATRRGIAANKPTKPSAPAEKPSSPFAPADLGDVPRKIKRPAKTRFYLREKLGQGQFLHMSCQGLTEKRIHAWIGTEQQLAAVRKTFAASKGLVEEVAQ